MQATLATPARFSGAGLHSGAPVRMTIHPAPAGHGIVFRRTDMDNMLIPARWDRVVPSQLCTLLQGNASFDRPDRPRACLLTDTSKSQST